MERWRDAWLAPLLAALTSQDARLRANTAHYVLPLPLAMDSGSLPVLLARLHAAAAGDAGDGACECASTGRVRCDAMEPHGLEHTSSYLFCVLMCWKWYKSCVLANRPARALYMPSAVTPCIL